MRPTIDRVQVPVKKSGFHDYCIAAVTGVDGESAGCVAVRAWCNGSCVLYRLTANARPTKFDRGTPALSTEHTTYGGRSRAEGYVAHALSEQPAPRFSFHDPRVAWADVYVRVYVSWMVVLVLLVFPLFFSGSPPHPPVAFLVSTFSSPVPFSSRPFPFL